MAKRQRNPDGGLVYSTETGRVCPGCLRPASECVCKDRSNKRSSSAGDGFVHLHRQTKGRKGAGVTLITGLPLDAAGLKDLAKRLKSACGVGGAVKDGVIELQGEQREKVKPLLEAAGYRVKISGA